MRRAMWAVAAAMALGGCVVTAPVPTQDVRLSASQACVDTIRRQGLWVNGVQSVSQIDPYRFDVVANVQLGPYLNTPRLCRFDASTGQTWMPAG
jgi:hypothetical protein